VCGQIHAPPAFAQRKEPPLPIGEEAGWASEPVWTEKFPATAGTRTPAHPARTTELSWLM